MRDIFQGQKISVVASGRTDAMVHARAINAHVRVDTQMPPIDILRAINSQLPKEIRVTAAEFVTDDFHAQQSARGKTYCYYILHDPETRMKSHWPFLRRYSWYVPWPLDYEVMRQQLRQLVGEHDFACFQNVGTDLNSTVRTIHSADLICHSAENQPAFMPPAELSMQLIEIRLQGNGFLKQMVRNIVGTIVEFGTGRAGAPDITTIIASRDRSQAGATAPGYGLFLDHVEY